MPANSDQKFSRAESSRINGAKSNGPVTPEGKQRSSYNRTTHGMRSTRIVLQNESQETYNDLRDLFFHLFDPRDIFKHECVSNMANARWRIRRLEAADTANLNLAMEESRLGFEQKYENLESTHEHALAYRAIAQTTGSSDIIARHEDRSTASSSAPIASSASIAASPAPSLAPRLFSMRRMPAPRTTIPATRRKHSHIRKMKHSNPSRPRNPLPRFV